MTAVSRQGLGRVLARHPSAVLLVVQLVFVLAYPYLVDNAVSRAIIGVAQMAVVLTAVWAVRRTPALTWVATTLGLPTTVFTCSRRSDPSRSPAAGDVEGRSPSPGPGPAPWDESRQDRAGSASRSS